MMMLTFEELQQVREYILHQLPRVLEQDPEFVLVIEGIVSERFPRRDEFARLLDEFTSMRREQRDGFQGLNERTDKLDQNVRKLRTGQDELRADVSTLRTGQDELRADVSTLRTGQDELRADVSTLRTGQDELRADVSTLRTGQDELRADVSTLRTGQDELRAGQDELRADVNTLRTGQDELRAGQDKLRAGQDELRADVNTLRTGQGELRAGQDELRADVNVLRQDVVALRTGQEEIKADVSNLYNLIDQRTEDLKKFFNDSVTKLGQRWGLMTEDVLRQVVQALVQGSYGGTVREVLIGGDQYDIVITDGQHILLEVATRSTQKIIRRLQEKRQRYTAHTGIEPSRVILATGQIHESVARKLRDMGVEVLQPILEEEEEGS